MTESCSFAKLIRVLTVPPVMAALLILALWTGRHDIIQSGSQAAMGLFFLAVLPVLAYPLAALFPPLREKGREGQRNLAFALSAMGYVGGFLYGMGFCGRTLFFIFTVYLFSVLILLIFNKLLHLRASGHACSVAGPMVTIILLLGGWWTPVCVLLYGASFWASVRSGRHTVGEYLLGTLSVLLAIVLAWLLILR